MADIRQQLRDVFEDTVKLYSSDEKLKEAVKKTREGTRLYEADDYPELPESAANKSGRISITKHRTFEAAMLLRQQFPDKKIAVHNFASATSPGGGVVNGAGAQEECLCRCSTLYASLTIKQMWESYYDVNRKEHDVLHTDACIFSPDVVVFKTDELIPKRMEPDKYITVDIVTCAAPNLREAPSNRYNRETGSAASVKPEQLYNIHLKRAKHILHTAAANGDEIIVLGAFGCGAFRNDPSVVAGAYRDALKDYAKYFEEIEFAVFCKEHETGNYDTFRKKLATGRRN